MNIQNIEEGLDLWVKRLKKKEHNSRWQEREYITGI
jgi:hypothetical protein